MAWVEEKLSGGSPDVEVEVDDIKQKKVMKTPEQLILLEKVYADDKYPKEHVRAELAKQLGLTSKQMLLWFCNRRRKDRQSERKTTDLRTAAARNRDSPPLPPTAPLSAPPAPHGVKYAAAALAAEAEDSDLFSKLEDATGKLPESPPAHVAMSPVRGLRAGESSHPRTKPELNSSVPDGPAKNRAGRLKARGTDSSAAAVAVAVARPQHGLKREGTNPNAHCGLARGKASDNDEERPIAMLGAATTEGSAAQRRGSSASGLGARVHRQRSQGRAAGDGPPEQGTFHFDRNRQRLTKDTRLWQSLDVEEEALEPVHQRRQRGAGAEQAAIAELAASLGGGLRPDGPAVGVYFDPLPLNAFGTSSDCPRPQQWKKQKLGALVEPGGSLGPKSGEKALTPQTAHQPLRSSVTSVARSRAVEPSLLTLASASRLHVLPAPDTEILPMPPKGLISIPPLAVGEGPGGGSGASKPRERDRPPSEFFGAGSGSGTLPEGRRVSHLDVEAARLRQIFAKARAAAAQAEMEAAQAALDEMKARRSSDSAYLKALEVAHAPSLQREREDEEFAKLVHKRKAAPHLEWGDQGGNNPRGKKQKREVDREELAHRKHQGSAQKELDRQERERRREEERLVRERLKEGERLVKEQQREVKRMEKERVKEVVRLEKRRQRDEKRQAREAAKEKEKGEKMLAKKRARVGLQLVEDTELEAAEARQAALLRAGRGDPAALSLKDEGQEALEGFSSSNLSQFPPKKVAMAHPLPHEPWLSSSELVGDLLMVWSFLTSFAHSLGLFPFTLNELAQGLHDPESRLLGEVHMALLKALLHDIHMLSHSAAGSEQPTCFSAASYVALEAKRWGFCATHWARLLNPLTWPEVLRQYALAAGWGPKRVPPKAVQPSDLEGKDSVETVELLRSGKASEAAARKVVAHRRQLSSYVGRRALPRMTPGTVRFGAFHVLCVEGPAGLSVTEIAERMQACGLRNWARTRTPENSIAGTVSRDPLFCKVAPSRYCLKAQFRKDPKEAGAMLRAAREQVEAVGGLRAHQEGEEEEDDDDDEDEVEEGVEADEEEEEIEDHNGEGDVGVNAFEGDKLGEVGGELKHMLPSAAEGSGGEGAGKRSEMGARARSNHGTGGDGAREGSMGATWSGREGAAGGHRVPRSDSPAARAAQGAGLEAGGGAGLVANVPAASLQLAGNSCICATELSGKGNRGKLQEPMVAPQRAVLERDKGAHIDEPGSLKGSLAVSSNARAACCSLAAEANEPGISEDAAYSCQPAAATSGRGDQVNRDQDLTAAEGRKKLELEAVVPAKARGLSMVTGADICKQVGAIDGEEADGEGEEGCGAIDGSSIGEPWVAALAAGEYSELSVEERMRILIALVNSANESGFIRAALEERAEAAWTLRRRSRAQGPGEKRSQRAPRGGSPNMLFSGGGASGSNVMVSGVTAEPQDPIASCRELRKESGPTAASAPSPVVAGAFQVEALRSGIRQEQDSAEMKGLLRANSFAARAQDMFCVRKLPLGRDRRFNRYWHFSPYGPTDRGSELVFFESFDDGHWEVVERPEAQQELLSSLDVRGVREAELHAAIAAVIRPAGPVMHAVATAAAGSAGGSALFAISPNSDQLASRDEPTPPEATATRESEGQCAAEEAATAEQAASLTLSPLPPLPWPRASFDLNQAAGTLPDAQASGAGSDEWVQPGGADCPVARMGPSASPFLQNEPASAVVGKLDATESMTGAAICEPVGGLLHTLEHPMGAAGDGNTEEAAAAAAEKRARYGDLCNWLCGIQTRAAAVLAEMAGARLAKVHEGTSTAASVMKVDQGKAPRCTGCCELLWRGEQHCPHCHCTWDATATKVAGGSDGHAAHVADCERQKLVGGATWQQLGPPVEPAPQVKALKAVLMDIEFALPEAMVEAAWMQSIRTPWVERVKQSYSPGELLLGLGQLEEYVHRSHLSPAYETADQLLRRHHGCGNAVAPGGAREILPPWVPHTAAAVAFRVLSLDAALSYKDGDVGWLADDVAMEPACQLDHRLAPIFDMTTRRSHGRTPRGCASLKQQLASGDAQGAEDDAARGEAPSGPQSQVDTIPPVGGGVLTAGKRRHRKLKGLWPQLPAPTLKEAAFLLPQEPAAGSSQVGRAAKPCTGGGEAKGSRSGSRRGWGGASAPAGRSFRSASRGRGSPSNGAVHITREECTEPTEQQRKGGRGAPRGGARAASAPAAAAVAGVHPSKKHKANRRVVMSDETVVPAEHTDGRGRRGAGRGGGASDRGSMRDWGQGQAGGQRSGKEEEPQVTAIPWD